MDRGLGTGDMHIANLIGMGQWADYLMGPW